KVASAEPSIPQRISGSLIIVPIMGEQVAAPQLKLSHFTGAAQPSLSVDDADFIELHAFPDGSPFLHRRIGIDDEVIRACFRHAVPFPEADTLFPVGIVHG